MQLKNTLLWMLLILINSQVIAAPRIRVLPISEPRNDFVFFTNTSQLIPLELTGINECVNVKAILWQLTTRLGIEISQQSIIDCSKTSDDFTQTSVKLDFQFRTPIIKHESSFKFEFTACNKQLVCHALGDFSFTVLPTDLLEPVRVWAKKHSLYVNDKSNYLLTFLDEHLIEYSHSKRLLPIKETVISLIVITRADMEIDKLLPRNKSQAVILFRQYPSEFPLIIDKTNNAIPLLDVQMPLIEKLNTEAAAQKLLLKLFYMLPQTIVTH